jgi:hypothetical protein
VTTKFTCHLDESERVVPRRADTISSTVVGPRGAISHVRVTGGQPKIAARSSSSVRDSLRRARVLLRNNDQQALTKTEGRNNDDHRSESNRQVVATRV